MKQIRQPIVVLMGHVDHGKSSIIEKIREISITKGEAGGITQTIRSYTVPLDTIKRVCGDLVKKLKLTIPGILFIDTPGHAAFTNLRKRGGNLADIAVLVIDINEGIKPQTIEAIEILRNYKTPFIIALNKIDLIYGWKSKKDFLASNINSQSDSVKKLLDNKLYTVVGKLYELNLTSERFDKIEDYTKQIAIVPISAKTSEGIPELLMVLGGLSQKYLEDSLKIEVSGDAKGTVLEVKEERGLGTTLDVIIYDGTLRVNDQIVIGGLEKPIITKVRSLFEPEMNRLKQIKKISAAAGVKISAPNIKEVIAGMPIKAANTNLEEVKNEIQREVEEVIIETDNKGIVVKADSLGSLEALINLLKEKGIKIKRASIGKITKKDIADATAELDLLNKVILGFNVKAEASENLKIITSDIIYKVIDEFELWLDETKKSLEAKELEDITFPCKIKIIPGFVFRQSNPAIVGVDVLVGRLRVNTFLMKNGKELTKVKSIQHEKENLNEIKSGNQAAVSLPRVIVGRQINENDVLYSHLSEDEFRKLKKFKKYLNSEEVELLKEIAQIMRKNNAVWGI